MPSNTWEIGALYPQPGGINGIWTQPGGPNTTVYPKQESGNTDLFTQVPYNELTGQYIGSCGHSFNSCMVFREYNYNDDISVALLSCPQCGCVQRTVQPYEDALITGVGLGELILFP
jgi:hypothetical protein